MESTRVATGITVDNDLRGRGRGCSDSNDYSELGMQRVRT